MRGGERLPFFWGGGPPLVGGGDWGGYSEDQLLEAIRLVKLTLKKLCDTCVVLTLREYKKYVLSNIEMSEK